jgi:hypothetical protein
MHANDFNLSDLEDEDKKRKLLELDFQIDNDQLTRGERRKLQNQRNVLKSRIKKELENEGQREKITRLQKKVFQ